MTQFIVIIAFTLVLISILYFTLKNEIPSMPTNSVVIKDIKKILTTNFSIKPNTRIYELGSGWGSIVFPLAKKFPLSQITGYENSHIPFFYSFIRKFLTQTPNVTLKNQDFFQAPLDDADIIICYLYSKGMTKLYQKLTAEENSKTTLISIAFAIPGIEADQIIQSTDFYRTKIYVYTVN